MPETFIIECRCAVEEHEAGCPLEAVGEWCDTCGYPAGLCGCPAIAEVA